MNQAARVSAFKSRSDGSNDQRHHPEPLAAMRDFMQALRRHRLALVIWLMLSLGAAVLYLISTPPQYTASTYVILDGHRPYDATVGSKTAGFYSSMDAAQAESQIQVIRSERLLRTTFDALKLGNAVSPKPFTIGFIERIKDMIVPGRLPIDPQDAAFAKFMSEVGARRVGTSYVLEISFRAPNLADAVRTANSITAAYIWDQIATNAALAQRGGEFLQSRIADFASEQAQALSAVAAGEIPQQRFPDADARVIGGALKPMGKSFPRTGLVILFALSSGLMTALLFVFIRNAFDRRVRTRLHVVEHLKLDCLSAIPVVRANDPWQFLQSDRHINNWDRSAEAIRELSVSLAGAFGSGPLVIGVAAWNTGEGVSTVAAGLACVLADNAEDVVLVDGNHMDLERGLTRRLRRFSSFSFDESYETSSNDGTWTLGNKINFVPMVPQKDTAGMSLRQLLHLRATIKAVSASWTIIDLPALSKSGSIRMLGPNLDGVILVIDARRTSIEDANEAVASLSTCCNVVGVVLNKHEALGRSRSRRFPRSM